MATQIKRMLHLKLVRFRSGRRKNFVAPALDTLLLKVQERAPKFAQRHFPSTDALPEGTLCAFISNIRQRKNCDGVMFDMNVYTYGMSVEQFNPDFSKTAPDINQGRIVDSEGKKRDILHTYRCLALGQALLVKYNRSAGGMHILELLLRQVFQQHCDEKLPGVELMDVTTHELDKAIKAGGGVDAVSLRLIGGSKPPPDAAFSLRLSELGKQVKGAKRVKVVWETEDDVLDAKSVLALASEYANEKTPLDKMAIQLKDGGSIPSLEKYRERRRTDVGLTMDGAIIVADIETGLFHYLDELRAVQNGWRVIDDQGNFVAPKVVSSKG